MLEDIALGGAGFAVLMNITGVAIPIWNIWNARVHLGLLDLMEQVIILAIYSKLKIYLFANTDRNILILRTLRTTQIMTMNPFCSIQVTRNTQWQEFLSF